MAAMPSLDPPNFSPLTKTVAEVIEAGRDEDSMETAAVVLDTIVGECGPNLTAADLSPTVLPDDT